MVRSYLKQREISRYFHDRSIEKKIYDLIGKAIISTIMMLYNKMQILVAYPEMNDYHNEKVSLFQNFLLKKENKEKKIGS